MSNATPDNPPLPSSPDWRVVVEVDSGIDGWHYHGDMYRDGVWMCRVALAGSIVDRPSAEKALWQRMQAWVVDYESRQHTGDTEFPPL